jgi:hypothetical protein
MPVALYWIPLTGGGVPHVCETSRLPLFIESPLTDAGGVILTRRPRFTTRMTPGINSCTKFRLSACITVPQQSTLQHEADEPSKLQSKRYLTT